MEFLGKLINFLGKALFVAFAIYVLTLPVGIYGMVLLLGLIPTWVITAYYSLFILLTLLLPVLAVIAVLSS